MTDDRIDLLGLTLADLRALLERWGQPRFRAAQVWRWLYHAMVTDPEAMSNLPGELRALLAQRTRVGVLAPVDCSASEDGLTEKVLFQTGDGQYIETVLMRYEARNTICVSSQVGCPVGCGFCATGQSGFVRNLDAGEMVAQVLHFARALRPVGQVTNVVLMGMGEPLLNYDAVWRAIGVLHDSEGLGLGARRFTLSTAGVVPGIDRMAAEPLEVGLAVSLHAPDDALRDRLVPLNRRYDIGSILDACRRYIDRTGRRVTFEYALIRDVNDSQQHARRTAALLRGLLCHVNLIAVNATAGSGCEPSSWERMLAFQETLLDQHVQTTVRQSRGQEIQAGCGQLRGAHREPSWATEEKTGEHD
ncbi:MAG: 23S rRNA (adenine(2503)-C(2))-methyltransferase RlmN [Anaerolineae bacterium]